MKKKIFRIIYVFFLLTGLIFFHCSGRSGIEIDHVKTEYQSNPVGLDVLQPRFSWVLNSEDRGEKQTAFQILVASKQSLLEEDKGDLWDSGKIDTSQSVHVIYTG